MKVGTVHVGGGDLGTLGRAYNGKHLHANADQIKRHERIVKRTSKMARKFLQCIVGSKHETTSSTALVTTTGGKVDSIDRLTVEYCCSSNSELGKSTKASKACKTMRVHEHIKSNSKEC